MVSKLKKFPFKPARTCRNTRRKSSPLKKTPVKKTPLKNVVSASPIVIASINKSIFSCKRCLLSFFTGIIHSGTPTRRRKGFRRLQNIDECELPPFFDKIPAETPRNTLPSPVFPDKKTVFLDLDETLIHSKAEPPPEKYDFVVRPTIGGEIMTFYVLKRPGVDELLEEIGKNFEIVVFTAGLKEYASLVLDKLDSRGVISHRLYRDSCKEMAGKFVKDLSEFGRDLNRVVIVDDNPNAYVFQPANAVPVSPFVDDLGDRELWKLVKFFQFAADFEDMKEAVELYLEHGSGKLI